MFAFSQFHIVLNNACQLHCRLQASADTEFRLAKTADLQLPQEHCLPNSLFSVSHQQYASTPDLSLRCPITLQWSYYTQPPVLFSSHTMNVYLKLSSSRGHRIYRHKNLCS